MPAAAKTDKTSAPKPQAKRPPAKNGHDESCETPAADSPKPHGDPLKHVIDEQ